MYGKFFASTFTGSMFGAGPEVFAVWGYVIANTFDSEVELNPPLLAAVIGTTPEAIAAAIDFLCQADRRSRSQVEDGRRLIPDGAFQYRVVNHSHYRAIRNAEDKRTQDRDRKRKSRALMSHSVSHLSAQTEAETETHTEAKTEKIKTSRASRVTTQPAYDIEFMQFWEAYPKKTGKGEALKAWNRAEPPLAIVLEALSWQRDSDQWNKDGGQYRPNPSTYLNQRRWEDQPPEPVRHVPMVVHGKGDATRDAMARAVARLSAKGSL